MTFGQKINREHINLRHKFALEITHCVSRKLFSHRNILLTDESQIWIGSFNKDTKKFWRLRGEHLFDESLVIPTDQHPTKCMVWVGLHYKAGLIGPVFCDEYAKEGSKKKNLTAIGYKKMLKEFVVPQLREKLSPEEFAECWFRQDGASIHTTKEVL